MTLKVYQERLCLYHQDKLIARHARCYERHQDIEDPEVGRSRLIDGWGIHWVPGRGWTYNLWGFRCVQIKHLGRTVRIGTDDPGGLHEAIAAALDS